MITEGKTSVLPQTENDSRDVMAGKEKIGWLCTYTPEEIIIAAGLYPSRIIGNAKALKAEGYFPINFCPFIKSSMEDILSSSYDFKGIIFTNSCDGMRRLYDTCKKYLPELPSFMLDVPRNKNELAIEHFMDSISNMMEFLENLTGKRIDEHLLEMAIQSSSEKRMLLKKLSNYYKNRQELVGIRNYHKILERAMTEEPDRFIEYIRDYIQDLEYKIKEKPAAGKSVNSHAPGFMGRSPIPEIMIIGNFINEEKLWEIFDEPGCMISAEDLCNSSRYFENITQPAELGFLLDSRVESAITKNIRDIAVRYLYKPQCMRMADLGSKISEIINSIEKNNIKGVIFISQKFCDNTLLFYPLLREKLSGLNIPNLFLEIEHKNLSSGQVKTRIQAFLEII